MEKIKGILKKVCTKEVIFYVLFGALTTGVNLISFFIFTKVFKLNENVSNIIAIISAAIFAYVTNKNLVFHSNANTLKEKLIQFGKFMSGRAFTMLIEWGGCMLLFLTPINQMLSKLAMTVIVVFLNFFISKFFAFKK